MKLAFTVALAVLVVSASALFHTMMMYDRVGENAVAALPPPTLSSRAPASAPAVLLLRSSATAHHFATVPGGRPDAYEQRVGSWRQRLETDGAAVRVIDEAALLTLRSPAPLVIVAPSAIALDDAVVAHLVALVEGGAGLVATWGLGLYDGAGAWRGYGTLERLAGLTPLGGDPAAEAPRFVALHGQTSVTAGLPAGARLEIQPYDRPLPLTSSAAIADYVDWSMLRRTSAGDARPQTAVVRARVGSGRVVWMNFEPGALVGGGVGPDRLALLVRNALAWTSRRPLAVLETWPSGARIAASLGLDAEHRFEESREIAERLVASRVPFTSFVLTSLAVAHPEALAALAGVSEIGSHTHDHRPLSEQDEAAQRRQLDESRRIVAALTGRTVLGLRPPEERANAQTLQALAEEGYHYIVGWREKDAAEPSIHQANGKAVVVLPRIPHDDYEYAVRRPNDEVTTAWASMRADLQQVRRLGGFYFFDFHTQFWDAPAIRTGVGHLTGLRNLPGVWLATVGEVAAWWRLRSRAAVGVGGDADGGLTVEIASGAAADALGVVVYVPRGAPRWQVASVRGAVPAAVAVGGLDDAVRLEFRDLAAGERRVVRLIGG